MEKLSREIFPASLFAGGATFLTYIKRRKVCSSMVCLRVAKSDHRCEGTLAWRPDLNYQTRLDLQPWHNFHIEWLLIMKQEHLLVRPFSRVLLRKLQVKIQKNLGKSQLHLRPGKATNTLLAFGPQAGGSHSRHPNAITRPNEKRLEHSLIILSKLWICIVKPPFWNESIRFNKIK